MPYKNPANQRKYAREYATQKRRKRGAGIMGKGWINSGSFIKGQSAWNKGKPNTWQKLPRTLETRIKIGNAHRGEKGSNWKGGITPINKGIRHGLEFALWRESIFKRDEFACQKCKVSGGYLHPHHILNFAEHIDLRFAIDNGITLCKHCHNLFHKIYGLRNNTREQLNEFLQS